jgi:hypothetical protein
LIANVQSLASSNDSFIKVGADAVRISVTRLPFVAERGVYAGRREADPKTGLATALSMLASAVSYCPFARAISRKSPEQSSVFLSG